jgi:hypothetical protein
MSTEIEEEILNLLAFEWRGRRQADIVSEVGRPKTSVRDALLRLEEKGQVERAAGRWYLANKAVRVERAEWVPEPEAVAEPEVRVEEVLPTPTWHRELLDNVTFLPSAELDLGPVEPEPEPGNRDEPEPWRPSPEVEIRVTVPTWLARRVFEVLEQAAREARP